LDERRVTSVEGDLVRDRASPLLGGRDQAIDLGHRLPRRFFEQERDPPLEDERADGDRPIDRHHHDDGVRALGVEHRRGVRERAGVPEVASKRLGARSVEATAAREHEVAALSRAARLRRPVRDPRVLPAPDLAKPHRARQSRRLRPGAAESHG
jgi:hypothetical protein